MNLQIVVDAMAKVINDIINFIPNLINGLIILIIGYLLALITRSLLGLVLRRLKFDPLAERMGLTGSLRGLGIATPLSTILQQAVFVLLLLSFLITSTRLMGLEPVARVFERVLAFLPTFIAALVVFLIGGIAAQYVGNMVTTVATGTGIRNPGRLGKILQYLISLFVVIMALGVTGVDTGLLITAVTILIAAFGLAGGLALGLGARGIVNHILAGYYMRQRFQAGQAIAINEVNGAVSGVGGVNTVVTTPEGTVVLPNSLLLESIVRSPLDTTGSTQT